MHMDALYRFLSVCFWNEFFFLAFFFFFPWKPILKLLWTSTVEQNTILTEIIINV